VAVAERGEHVGLVGLLQLAELPPVIEVAGRFRTRWATCGHDAASGRQSRSEEAVAFRAAARALFISGDTIILATPSSGTRICYLQHIRALSVVVGHFGTTRIQRARLLLRSISDM